MPENKSFRALTLMPQGELRHISDNLESVMINDLKIGSCFDDVQIRRFRDANVLVITDEQMPTVLAALDLDGVANRILFCTPDIADHIPAILNDAEVDFIVTDGSINIEGVDNEAIQTVLCNNKLTSLVERGGVEYIQSEWVLFTSGTTGKPKMVSHTLESLSGPLNDGVTVANGAIWSTFYDVRRYGGMQILLRALIGGGSMILRNKDEPLEQFLDRLAANGLTHISGTPSHWRHVLMTEKAKAINPQYVRLSGETADQAILDALKRTYPTANLAHAFASTEAGVAFDVRDGLAGFPASFLESSNHIGVEMKVVDDTLRIRSSRNASSYIGGELQGSGGFIDTGDIVLRQGDRYYFRGRREGVINVGGQKVFPEEVEDVITQHPKVIAAKVWPRKNPILGSIVACDLVLQPDSFFESVRYELIQMCNEKLAPHKVPAMWHRVDNIEMTSAGKVKRA